MTQLLQAQLTRSNLADFCPGPWIQHADFSISPSSADNQSISISRVVDGFQAGNICIDSPD
jgi:hypothetical protein